ncbi:MAG: radical SAM protein [Chloroflexi bacterium]|nr:MAG: radical SAM protein [Chloroflexota bacterium]
MLAIKIPTISGTIHLGLKRESTTIDVDHIPSYYFDRKGRLLGGHTGERTYRRTFDNRVIAKWSEPIEVPLEHVKGLPRENMPVAARKRHVRRRQELPPDEARRVVETARGLAVQAEAALKAGEFTLSPPEDVDDATIAEARARLQAIVSFDYDALAQDARQFRALYAPIGILPPDQYLALVLQATLGCPWNRCTFCTFYRDRNFLIRKPEQFRQHVAAVKAYHGPALSLFKSIFLADANALTIPQRMLVPIFEAIVDTFDIEPPDLTPDARQAWRADHPHGFDGIYSFISALDALHKSPEHFAELRALGLRRAYIGLESGDEALLRFLSKPNTPQQAIEAVKTIKAGGVAVGVVIMLGIGGDRYADDHVAHTVEAINAMDLGPGDIIYFSEFVDPPNSPYDARARAENIRPLTRPEIWAQEAAMRAGFRFRDGRPKISVYDIREFIY